MLPISLLGMIGKSIEFSLVVVSKRRCKGMFFETVHRRRNPPGHPAMTKPPGGNAG